MPTRQLRFHSSLIVVDTREGLPLGFPGATRATLRTGDYAIRGWEERCAIERKELSDFLACVGRERDRFERELARLGELEYGAVVIEASLSDVVQGTPYSRVHPQAAVSSILAWSVRYRLPFFLAEDRRGCRSTVYHLLRHFWQQQQESSP